MPRRKIPLGNIEEMLECVAEISDHFMVNAADMMPEEKKQEICIIAKTKCLHFAKPNVSKIRHTYTQSGHQNNARFCYFMGFQTPFERHLKPPSPTHIQCSRVDPQKPFSNTNQA